MTDRNLIVGSFAKVGIWPYNCEAIPPSAYEPAKALSAIAVEGGDTDAHLTLLADDIALGNGPKKKKLVSNNNT
jgi:hypothetical protein